MPLTPDAFERAMARPAELAGATFEPGLLAEMVADVANEPGALPLLQYALMLLAREAVRLDASPETDGTLLSTLLRSPAALATFPSPITDRPQADAVSPDGKTLEVVENTNYVRFYDTATRRERGAPLPDSLHIPASFSADGRLVVVARARSSTSPMLLDVRNGHSLGQIAWLGLDRRWAYGPTSFVAPILISPDDRRVYLAYATTDPSGEHDLRAYVDEWSVTTGKLLRSVAEPASGIFDANFGPDRHIHLLADDRLLTIDPSSLEPIASRHVALPETSIQAIAALSPDERTVMLGEPSGAVVFVDARTGRTTVGAGKTGVGVNAVTFTGNGRAAISAGEDGHVTIWNPRTANITATFVGHEDRITGMARTADSRTLYTTSLDGAVFAWDLTGVRAFGHPFVLPVMPAAQFWVTHAAPLALSPDGRSFATRFRFRTVAVVGLSTLTAARSFVVPGRAGSAVGSLAWSPAAPLLAVGTSDGTVGLWSVERGRGWFAGSSACRSPRTCRRR